MIPARASLRAQFAAFNREHFGGVLHPDLPVHWKRMNHFGDFSEADERYPYGLIRLTTKDMPACGWRGILLHEMVHAYVEFLDVEDEYEHGPAPWHGPRFVEEVNRIGATFGWPPATIENAWYWPQYAYDDHDPEPANDL